MVQAADVDLLRKADVSEDDIANSVKIAEKALEIAVRTNKKLDMELVGRGFCNFYTMKTVGCKCPNFRSTCGMPIRTISRSAALVHNTYANL